MQDKETITQPSSGSNELGRETNDTHLTSGLSTGTDTQLHLAALSTKKNKKDKDVAKIIKKESGVNTAE